MAFFRKCDSFFRSPNLKKKFQKTILSLKFEFPANNSKVFLAGNLNFKFRIVFCNIFFRRFGNLKNELHFLKICHLYHPFVHAKIVKSWSILTSCSKKLLSMIPIQNNSRKFNKETAYSMLLIITELREVAKYNHGYMYVENIATQYHSFTTTK